MIRVNTHLTNQQLNRLRALSVSTGLPVAEIVRRAIDAYLLAGYMEGEDNAKGFKPRRGKTEAR